MEMRYFWLLDGDAQKYFKFHYHPDQENLGDFHTKAFTGKDTSHARPYYLHEHNSPRQIVCALMPSTQQGCVGMKRDSYVHGKPLPFIRTQKVRTDQVLLAPAA